MAIVPSKRPVMARLGHYAGSFAWCDALDEGKRLLMHAVPDIQLDKVSGQAKPEP